MAVVSLPVPSRYRLNGFQKFWLVFQPALLLGVIGLAWLQNPEDARLFWAEPMGLKLAAWAIGLSVLNFVLLLGGCLVINRFGSSAAKGKWLVTLSQGVLYFGCMYFLALPALFTVLIGPAAVKAVRLMLSN